MALRSNVRGMRGEKVGQPRARHGASGDDDEPGAAGPLLLRRRLLLRGGHGLRELEVQNPPGPGGSDVGRRRDVVQEDQDGPPLGGLLDDIVRLAPPVQLREPHRLLRLLLRAQGAVRRQEAAVDVQAGGGVAQPVAHDEPAAAGRLERRRRAAVERQGLVEHLARVAVCHLGGGGAAGVRVEVRHHEEHPAGGRVRGREHPLAREVLLGHQGARGRKPEVAGGGLEDVRDLRCATVA